MLAARVCVPDDLSHMFSRCCRCNPFCDWAYCAWTCYKLVEVSLHISRRVFVIDTHRIITDERRGALLQLPFACARTWAHAHMRMDKYCVNVSTPGSCLQTNELSNTFAPDSGTEVQQGCRAPSAAPTHIIMQICVPHACAWCLRK